MPVFESFFRPAILLKIETTTQVFYCEFGEILKKTFITRTPPRDCFWRFVFVIYPFA